MAVNAAPAPPASAAPERPRWPSQLVDTGIAWVDYDVPADEFLVYFGGRPVPAVSDYFGAPGFDHVAIMVGLNPDDTETGEIVGVQVLPLLVGAVAQHPDWAALAWAAMAGDFGRESLRQRLPAFLAEVAAAFERHWSPPPPWEEQVARLAARPGRPETPSEG